MITLYSHTWFDKLIFAVWASLCTAWTLRHVSLSCDSCHIFDFPPLLMSVAIHNNAVTYLISWTPMAHRTITGVYDVILPWWTLYRNLALQLTCRMPVSCLLLQPVNGWSKVFTDNQCIPGAAKPDFLWELLEGVWLLSSVDRLKAPADRLAIGWLPITGVLELCLTEKKKWIIV